jgi:aspartyl/asparaginyl beta-hydroxylase (cupin superfamily)
MSLALDVSVTSDVQDCGCGDTKHGSVGEFLDRCGARELRHAHGRTLYDHLLGTRAILRRWLQPPWLLDAGTVHSVYSTDSYRKHLIPLSRRGDVRAVVGERAERLAWLFCILSRKAFWQEIGAHRELPADGIKVRHAADSFTFEPVSRNEAYHLMLLHMANLGEQARGHAGQPGEWLARVSAIGSLLDETEVLVPPLFASCTRIISPEEEDQARTSYLAGLDETDPAEAARRLSTSTGSCPWIAEPQVARAYLALQAQSFTEARLAIAQARTALIDLGVAWDPRLSYCDWQKVIATVEDLAFERRFISTLPPFDLSQAENLIPSLLGAIHDHAPAPPSEAPIASAPGVERFHRYVDSISRKIDIREARIYPGLVSRPWYDPAEFPLAKNLVSHYPEIRREMIQLERAGFHREAERIKRKGSWDVFMLFERGRKKIENCGRCPVTTRVIETHNTLRTQAGLIYFSRMKPGTHIAAHRGPTNMRLRCHLGLQVPEGDCRLRVDRETRRWTEGACIVFDDHFEHEAWNYTGGDRVVLIVDVWHPGLSPEEVRLLEGLHWYALEVAQSLNRYWAANTRAANTRAAGSPATREYD